ncbi:MAG: hypothetical protein H5U40_12620 [Polyangiaceae bacterium]|nr:hypothetical protein [Polyangiaceae bacterium]
MRAGASVLRGEWVGRLGNERAPLRFELRRDGRAIDPRPLLVQLPDGIAL